MTAAEPGDPTADSAPTPTPAFPAGIRHVREIARSGDVPLHVHVEWSESMPWLVQGTTGSGDDGDGDGSFDLGLWGDAPVGPTLTRWRALRHSTGMPSAVHARQEHGTRILDHPGCPAPGLLVVEGVDGHHTRATGLLLTVSVADCVPVSLVLAEERRVALLHAGWRGTAAGMLAAGVRRLAGERPESLRAHLGPAICGQCYEVGPEVHEALGLPRPTSNTPVDVRAVQARQLMAEGVPPGAISVSEHCTRCGTGFFSHRAGSPGRQMGVLGIRP